MGWPSPPFLNNVKKMQYWSGRASLSQANKLCPVSCHCRKTDMQTKSGRERIFCVRFPSVGFLLTTSHLKRDTWSIKSFYYSINTLFVEPQLDGMLEKWVFEYVQDLSFGGTSKCFQFCHITGQLAFERLGNYVLCYNWFKIDIRWLLRPLTAIFSHVHRHLNYYKYII